MTFHRVCCKWKLNVLKEKKIVTGYIYIYIYIYIYVYIYIYIYTVIFGVISYGLHIDAACKIPTYADFIG